MRHSGPEFIRLGFDVGDRPTGTVTFLFTDVQGSTRLWEAHPEEMQAALIRHDALLREAIESHGGYVVKNRGDGFYAAFATGTGALAAAVAAQLAITNEPWNQIAPIKVRMALHTGTADERDGDYFGTTVNRTARLIDAAHGGQILISGTTQPLVRDDLPPDMELRDLGQHRLKDLTRADHIFQLVTPELPTEFPPLRTLARHPNNLPVLTTSFLGRERDISEVIRLLESTRLVSLIGTGGVGKTRLALEVAGRVLDTYPDGVWFADLAPLADPALLPQTVAGVLDIHEHRGETVETTLLQAMQGKQLLLVLDNCEHLIEACARLASNILGATSSVQILVTSREPLRIAGEVRWQVVSLSVPQSRRNPDLTLLSQYEAVQLFADRAKAVSPGFGVTDENGRAIADIVRHLDGIPLAIELAAARIGVFPVEQIAQRLENRFQLLSRGSRTALRRQQTLESLIEWSYDLLSEPERLLFQRLGVFAGGFTIDAAEQVGSGDGIDEIDVVDLLAQLVEKSLVVADEGAGEYRYRLLESLQEYARRRLGESGDLERLQRRHAEYFLSLAKQAEPYLFADSQAEWATRLRSEFDNVRAVLEWSRTHDLEAGLRLATMLWKVWWLAGWISEARSQMERLWESMSDSVSLGVQLDALHARGNLAFRDGDYEAGRQHFEDMRLRAEEAGDRGRVATALSGLGGMLVEQTDYEAAAASLRESIRLEREHEDVPDNPWIRIDLGLVDLGRGEYDEAAELFEESISMAQRDNDHLRLVIAECCQGLVAIALDNLTTARPHLETSLKLSWSERMDWVIPLVLRAFAALATGEGLHQRAARLSGAATAFLEGSSVETAPLWEQLLNAPMESARSSLEETEWAAAWAEGSGMSMHQAIEYALDRAESLASRTA